MAKFKFPTTSGPPDLSTMAKYLTSGAVRNVVIMVGAGISTAAGIPDFRSPKTGLYDNLSRLNLPYAEAVFDIDYFRKRPEAFYMLAHELYPGKFRPTVFHSFVKVLQDRGVLRRVYTQNIDTLERIAGVSDDKIVEAHGSFAENHCIDCGSEMGKNELEQTMNENKIPRCKRCGGLVKPDIVFFGEALPARFFKLMTADLQAADLVIVAGTSLQVHPFASLPSQVSCPRILFNLETVGDFGRRKTDVVVLGPCDESVRELAGKCGWGKQLDELWSKTAIVKSIEEEEVEGAKTQKEVLDSINKAAEEETMGEQKKDEDAGENADNVGDETFVTATESVEVDEVTVAAGQLEIREEQQKEKETAQGVRL
ncbi:DHS-like NAD/FAD-binding domain-containing protein [Lipomyces tetrasporus]|uniref:NAD-dependent protein deacetylase n=1 Tax=Lipomyces tetrasporus TaxID=54092 RepID=A0AAD7QYE2_9ASCO|nr:DHS-like NAD/FAD-binding domain-containing protein [Lipomyces tetrasporus]KAJ8102107.1 DHS-like NAD/FAD-binding domain-containing protein [Lipomyces tetrasporus]